MNVQLREADDRSSVRKEEVEAAEGQDDVIEHVVDQLQPFTTYEFAVAAATAAGQGPFSNSSSVRMPQEGKQRQEEASRLYALLLDSRVFQYRVLTGVFHNLARKTANRGLRVPIVMWIDHAGRTLVQPFCAR